MDAADQSSQHYLEQEEGREKGEQHKHNSFQSHWPRLWCMFIPQGKRCWETLNQIFILGLDQSIRIKSGFFLARKKRMSMMFVTLSVYFKLWDGRWCHLSMHDKWSVAQLSTTADRKSIETENSLGQGKLFIETSSRGSCLPSYFCFLWIKALKSW